MKEFYVTIEKSVSSIANVLEALAKNAINIKAISTEEKNSDIVVKLVTEDENSTLDILKRFNFDFKEREILPLKLADKPGELAKVTRKLSKSNIEINSIYILGKDPKKGETEVALTVSNVDKVRKMLA